MQKVLSYALLAGALAVTIPPLPQDRARGKEKTYKMVNVVEDFATSKWTLDCVPRGKIDLTQAALNDDGIAAFFDCLGEIESDAGVAIKSRTRVRNGVVQSDKVTSTTELTADDVEKLKGILDDPANRAPELRPVFVNARPRVQTVLCDGEVTEMIIVLSPSMQIDVFNSGLSGKDVGAILEWVEQLEQDLGVNVSNTTTVRDGQTEKDRVVAVTYFDAAAMQAAGQFLFGEQRVSVVPNRYLLPATMRGVIQLDEPIDGVDKFRFEVTGQLQIADTRFAPPSKDEVPIPVPIVVVDVSLQGPLPPPIGGQIVFDLLPLQVVPLDGVLGGGRKQSLLIPPDPLLGGLGLHFQSLTLSPGAGLRPAPIKVRMPPSKPARARVRGKAPLVEDPDGAATPRGTIKIQSIQLDPPFFNYVFPPIP